MKIQFLGSSPIDVEGFSKKIERTFEGALHLKPNKVYELSEGEFEFIKGQLPNLKFHVFKVEKKFERPLPKVEPKIVLPLVEKKSKGRKMK